MNLKELEHFDFFKKKIENNKNKHPKSYKIVTVASKIVAVCMLSFVFSTLFFINDVSQNQLQQADTIFLIEKNNFIENTTDKTIVHDFIRLLNLQELSLSEGNLIDLGLTVHPMLSDKKISVENRTKIKDMLMVQLNYFSEFNSINCKEYISCSLLNSEEDMIKSKNNAKALKNLISTTEIK